MRVLSSRAGELSGAAPPVIINMTDFQSKLYTWHGRTMFFGRLPDIKEHSHHALQIEIGLQKKFRIISGQDSLCCRFAIIPPNLIHTIDDFDSFQVVIYLEPESIIGGRLQKKYCEEGTLQELPFQIVMSNIDTLERYARQTFPCPKAGILLDDILNSLAGEHSPDQVLDARIEKAIRLCKQTRNKKISAKELADKVNLSEGRFIHLFKEQVGIPIRRYLLWLRLSDALMELSKGGSFTDAAHHAGFSDSAHMSRTYRRMYGNSLYDLARNSQFIQAIPCFE